MVMNYNLRVIHWRTVPVNSDAIGENARKREPLIKQAFVVESNTIYNSNVIHLTFKQRVKIDSYFIYKF